MKRINFLRISSCVMFFAFLITIGALSRPAFAQCEKTDTAKIIPDIYAKIRSDKRLAAQIPHFNAVLLAEQSTVKLQGWADNERDWESFRQIAAGSNCVKVNVNDFATTPPPEGIPSPNRIVGGSCQTGLKPCGSLCIPIGDACNSELP